MSSWLQLNKLLHNKKREAIQVDYLAIDLGLLHTFHYKKRKASERDIQADYLTIALGSIPSITRREKLVRQIFKPTTLP